MPTTHILVITEPANKRVQFLPIDSTKREGFYRVETFFPELKEKSIEEILVFIDQICVKSKDYQCHLVLVPAVDFFNTIMALSESNTRDPYENIPLDKMN